uniref:Uncharacterized protein n=1 Tax=Anguilla anguilla TaxID=7936 RepID=A0A0E9V5F0_ANGAN
MPPSCVFRACYPTKKKKEYSALIPLL